MENTINTDELLQFLREKVEPVHFKNLVLKFCSLNGDKKTRRENINQLKMKIGSLLTSGSILHSNDYFYAASFADDFKDLVELSSEDDGMSDKSDISYSSSGSSAEDDLPNFNDLDGISSSEDEDDARENDVHLNDAQQGDVPQDASQEDAPKTSES